MTGRSQRPIWLGADNRRWDHARLHLQMLEDDRLHAIELAVYFGLAAHAEVNSGAAFPAVDTLATYCGLGERRVRTAIRNLESAGYVRCDQVPGKASRYYLLPMPAVPTEHLPEHPRWAHHDGASHTSTPAPGARVGADTPPDPGTEYRTSPAPGADEQEPREPEPENDMSDSAPRSPDDARVGDPDNHWSPDTLRLTRQLASRVKANGHRVPKPKTKGADRWFDTIDKLFRVDKLDPAEVAGVIEWATDPDCWWSPNLRSAFKFRENYSMLRGQMNRDQHARQRDPNDQRVDYVTDEDGVTRARFYGNG